MLAWDLDFLNQATQSIEFGAYVSGGKVFYAIMDKIKRRLEVCPDLQVYVLASPSMFQESDKEIVSYLSENYPSNFHIQYSNYIFSFFTESATIENHMKFLVVDEHYFSVGGTNFHENLCTEGTTTPSRKEGESIVEAGLPAGTRDQDVVGKGPVAKDLRVMFHKIFAMWEHYFETREHIVDPELFSDNNYYRELRKNTRPYAKRFEKSENLIKTSSIRMIYSGSMHCPNKITEEYVRLIDNSKEEISIGNFYSAPVKPIFNALLNAVNRNVDLTVITNGTWENSPHYCKFIGWSNRMRYVPFYYGREYHFWEKSEAASDKLFNTRIYEYHVNDILYHKKLMVVDRRYVVIGSYNLGMKSDSYDYELVLVIDSEEAAKNVLKVLEKDKKFSTEMHPKQAREWYFNPFLSYLGALQDQFNGYL